MRRSDEAIELVKGANEVQATLAKFASKAKIEIDVCSDRASLQSMVKSGEIAKILESGEGLRVRCLTEITKETEDAIRKLSEIVEIRHFDGVTGNFAISDNEEYVGPLVTEDGHLGQLIYSNAKPLFEQHRYLFDLLWERAVPAKVRFAELSGAAPVVQTRLMEGESDILRSMKKVIGASDELVGCTTIGALETLLEELPDALAGVVKRRKSEGGGIRWVTSIEVKDADVVERCLRMGIDVRHTSRLPPLSFQCSRDALVASIQARGEGMSMQNVLTSNEPAYVNHFRLVFEEIWKNGVGGRKWLDDIRRGLENSNVEIIENAHESMKIAWNMVESGTEVLMMFATPNAFIRQIRDEAFERLKTIKGPKTEAKVKLLIPDDERVAPIIETLRGSLPSVECRLMNKSLKTKISILIVDRMKTMVFETKDDAMEDLYEALGVATYTESKSLAESYATIFEGLWKQTELYEQLEVHDKMQRDFVNIAAHELRTPVQAIINYAELAKTFRESREEYYDKLLKSVSRLYRLTEDILDAARIESRTLRLNKEVFLLNEVLRSSLDDQRRAAAKKHLKLQLGQPEPIYVFGDKSRVSQVLGNLLNNAIKFTDEGYVTLSGRVDKRAGKVVITVSDTGMGIDKDLMPHLFARFMAKSQSGTGLGLFISKNIIEEHGGRIWLEKSEPGKGSVFVFELPISSTIAPRKRGIGPGPITAQKMETPPGQS
jgi:signal transduction histidine kinase